MEVEIPRENSVQIISPRRAKLSLRSLYCSVFEVVVGLLLLFVSLTLYVYDPTIKKSKNTSSTSTTTLATPTTTPTSSTTSTANPPPSETDKKDILMIAIYIVRGVLSLVKGILLVIFLRCVPLKSTRFLSVQMIFALVQIPLTIASAILLIIRTHTLMIYFVVCDPFILIFFIVFLWIVYSYKKELLVFLKNRNGNQNPAPELPYSTVTSQSIKSDVSRQLIHTGAQLLIEGARMAIPEPEVPST